MATHAARCTVFMYQINWNWNKSQFIFNICLSGKYLSWELTFCNKFYMYARNLSDCLFTDTYKVFEILCFALHFPNSFMSVTKLIIQQNFVLLKFRAPSLTVRYIRGSNKWDIYSICINGSIHILYSNGMATTLLDHRCSFVWQPHFLKPCVCVHWLWLGLDMYLT